MNKELKQKLLELIDNHATFHGMYKEELFKTVPDFDKWNLMKNIRDEKLAEIKSIIEAI